MLNVFYNGYIRILTTGPVPDSGNLTYIFIFQLATIASPASRRDINFLLH
jgi:hypothetical protein